VVIKTSVQWHPADDQFFLPAWFCTFLNGATGEQMMGMQGEWQLSSDASDVLLRTKQRACERCGCTNDIDWGNGAVYHYPNSRRIAAGAKENMGKRDLTGYYYAIAAATLWGLAGPVAKHLFNNGVSALALTQVRQTASFFLLVGLFLIWRRRFLHVRLKDLPFFAVLGIAGLAMVQISYYSAISKIQVAPAILLQYMAPVFILLYAAIFMKERVTSAKAGSLLLAVAGCALTVGIYETDFFKLNLAGVAWGLASALFFSFYTLYGQSGLKKYSAMTLFCYASGFGAILWWVINPPNVFFAIKYSPLIWLGFAYIAVFGTTVPFVLYFEGLNRMEASRVSITSTLEPVVAGVAAFFFVGEKMSILQVLGGILVLIGIILLQRNPSPADPME